ncbi:MAG: hypothetical protein AAF614_33955 [Chloroflexota bacterium]
MSILKQYFPNHQTETTFVTETAGWLHALGFQQGNSIACVARCRDELAGSLVTRLEQCWGASFDLAGLGGFIFAGKTGLAAALSHAPENVGRPRYLFFAFPHIGISASGEVGYCLRPGQTAVSTACGALAALLGDLQSGRPLDDSLDMTDIEMSLIRQRIRPLLEKTAVSDLLSLTHLAQEAITADLTSLITQAIDPQTCDYAVFSGVQIHGPDGENHIALATGYAVVKQQKHAFIKQP